MENDLTGWIELIDGIIWFDMHPDDKRYWLYYADTTDDRPNDYNDTFGIY